MDLPPSLRIASGAQVNGEGFLYNPAKVTNYEAFCMLCCGKNAPNIVYQNPDNSSNLK